MLKLEFGRALGYDRSMKEVYPEPGDNFALELHRRIAEKLRQNPALLEIARLNMTRWLSTDRSWSYRQAMGEWQEMIETLSLEDLIAEMLREDDEGQRIRSNSPFGGILSKAERSEVLEASHA